MGEVMTMLRADTLGLCLAYTWVISNGQHISIFALF